MSVGQGGAGGPICPAATGSCTSLAHARGGPHGSLSLQLALSLPVSLVFLATNVGLLTLAMATAEGRPAWRTWRERLGWFSPHYLVFGPLAVLVAAVYRAEGLLSLLALALPALLLSGGLRRSRTATLLARADAR